MTNRAQSIRLLFEEMERNPLPWKGWVHTITGEIVEFPYSQLHIRNLPPSFQGQRVPTEEVIIQYGWARVTYYGRTAYVDSYGRTPEMLRFMRLYFLERYVNPQTEVYWEDLQSGRLTRSALGDLGLGPSLTRRFR